MLDAGASGVFQVEIREIEFERCASVLVGEIDAGDAFVVGGEGEGNACGAIVGKRMPRRDDSEDYVVGGQVDLGHDVPVGHLL